MNGFQQSLDKLEFEKIRQRVMRYASSEPGKAVIQSLLPSTSLEDVKRDLCKVSELKRLLEEEAGLPLEGIHPIGDAVRRAAIEGTILQPKELSHVLLTLRAARAARQFVAKRHDRFPRIWEVAEGLSADKVLEYNLDQTVDESGSIKANASRELQTIRRAIAEKYEQTRKKLEHILKTVSEQGFTQDDIITTREGRMVIPVKSEHKNRVHGFIHSASASGATVFIEPSETLDLNNEIRSLQFQEQREIERILRDITIQIGELRDVLLRNLLILTELDAVNSKAKYSIETLGVEPIINESGPIKLLQARHPILLQTHGRDATIPLDIELGSSYNTLIISGPNAGGKSVAMKTVGILALMAQAGLHIPAMDQSVLRIFEKVFVDIGDEQSIENDLSTFSSHLKNLKSIEEEADTASLVLIDEIGSGTDPAEGGAIAAALLESLTSRGAFTIATTHHSALKVFAHNTEGVANGAMEFDQASLTPTYRFKSELPGSSYALEMAQRLGFNRDILSRSREFMGSQQAKLEHLVADLELSAQKFRNELEAVRNEKSRLDELVKTYESKISRQAAELKDLKQKAVEEARDIVENANAVIERSIREIRESSAEKETIKHVRENVKRVREEIESQRAEIPSEAAIVHGALDVGSFVKLAGGVETGEIVGLSPDARSAMVVFGSLKMKVATKDLILSKRKPAASRSASIVDQEKPQEVSRDIDLRGMTSEEAIPLVDKFIDTAVLSGLHRVDIIHGKGTGALRKKITDYLSKHPRVKSYRLGEWNEGGTGATVVELTEN